jgi:hypothetical protein
VSTSPPKGSVNRPKTFKDTHADLLRHAELYGTDCVYETARELHSDEAEVPPCASTCEL